VLAKCSSAEIGSHDELMAQRGLYIFISPVIKIGSADERGNLLLSPSSLDSDRDSPSGIPPPKVIRFIGWWLIGLFVNLALVAIFCVISSSETRTRRFFLVRWRSRPIQQ